ncbi:MAG: ATP-binding protein, partial [Cyanothece sp. SIO2G6]|nr:ATP-binding protein [Cyanothece sp. SIO2G6]
MGRNLSWVAGQHHAKLILKALHHFQQQSDQNTIEYRNLNGDGAEVMQLRWQTAQALWVSTTLCALHRLLQQCGEEVSTEQIRNALHCMKQLGILQDKREKTNPKTLTGSKEWQFILQLHSHDATDNLNWLFGVGDQPGYWDYLRRQQQGGRERRNTEPQGKSLTALQFPEGQRSYPSLGQIVRGRWGLLPWVGREALVASLVARLQDNCRILSLVGITGIGKTALSIRLSTEFPNQFQRFELVRFDDERPDFRFVARVVLGSQATDPQLQSPELQADAVFTKLQEQPWFLVLDMVEELLERQADGSLQFRDRTFKILCDRLVKAETLPSRLIITSQDALPPPAEGRYPNRTHTAKLSGLSQAESLQLFQLRDIIATSATDLNYLTRIIQVYEGHPLALQVIAGELRETPYDGKIPAYWHDYGAEIERVEHLRQAQAEQGPQDAIALDRYSRHLVD